MKKIVKLILKLTTKIIVLIYRIIHYQSKFRIKGIGIFTMKVKGNVSITVNSGYIVKSKFIINGNNNTLIFEDNVKISNCKFIVFGHDCLIHFRGSRIMSNTKFELLDSNTKLTAGNNTGFNKNRILVAGKNNEIKIGSNCIFAENVEIWASDTHSILDVATNKRINQDKPVLIGNRVWLGNKALIQKGVTIGNDAIIGAGSIVTKNIPDNTLVAGIPAKTIKSNIKWDINRL